VENLTEGRSAGESRELDFTPWGGPYNRVPVEATAFAHRDELFLIQHTVIVDPDVPTAEREAARHWLERSWMSVRLWGSGVYPNFPDPDLTGWARLPRDQLRPSGTPQGEIRPERVLPLRAVTASSRSGR